MLCADPKCKHEEKVHATPERHNLKTSHCTMMGCDCKKYKKPENGK